jgi:XTP/dITP diphosphohydrolase
MPNLLIASTNPGKLYEFQEIFAGLNLTWLSNVTLQLPSDLGIQLQVEETGATYAENAALKALAYSRASGLLTLADDSGLEVEALDGQPGLHSARYALDPHATDADRRALLLMNLHGKPRPWRAAFQCALALAQPDGSLSLHAGTCPGEIIPDERGSNGFGYDPIFLLPELGRSMAELTTVEKNQLSHRVRAVQAALPTLQMLLEER